MQQKIPMSLREADMECVSNYCGENVTIIEKTTGTKFVYKGYCYQLRQASHVMQPLLVVEDKDKRRPPPQELLDQLGSPYSEWMVHDGPFGTSVLCYPFLEGSSYRPSCKGWLKILLQIQKMHELGFVHGDLLPRNVLFVGQEDGFVIDFDLSRKEMNPYVKGFNYSDFEKF